MSAAERLDRSIAADRHQRGLANADALSEAEFQSHLVELAGILGWNVLHVRRSIGKGTRWTTTTSIVGWVDLLCWHPRHGMFAAELKSERGHLRPEQVEVLDSLAAAGIETHVWRPSDWPAIQARLTGRPS